MSFSGAIRMRRSRNRPGRFFTRKRRYRRSSTGRWTPPCPFARLPDPDTYAPEADFPAGFRWRVIPSPARCGWCIVMGWSGAGRDNAADSGGGTGIVCGDRPRTRWHLDRNVTLLGHGCCKGSNCFRRCRAERRRCRILRKTQNNGRPLNQSAWRRMLPIA